MGRNLFTILMEFCVSHRFLQSYYDFLILVNFESPRVKIFLTPHAHAMKLVSFKSDLEFKIIKM